MTKSTITRERLSDILEFGSGRLIKPISDEEIELMARMALAAMDSEPGKIIEVNVGGNTWVQCSEKAFENAKYRGELTRVLYEYPSAAVFLKD
ncbi:Uncharacterised protein [Klebsiella pneumoniae]|uniref:hypothetical protein n=1 Tax=Klebsiella pneumoniae TaxID=573 RepID=UPI000E2A4687|nr:hypothetical protein [Klebsiella pneumoniae]RFC15873.1 hypothetical protein DDJ38_18865 [Klebsiella pneumoniae]SXM37289.1 Uncharacterised protein [Klebsiella pneumoniae]